MSRLKPKGPRRPPDNRPPNYGKRPKPPPPPKPKPKGGK